jgi:hypothetical protein
MTLKSQMAADLTALFLNTDEFAESTTYTPNGTAIGATTTFSLNVVPGDIDPAFLPTVSGEQDQRTAQFVAVLSLVQAGIATVEGSSRDPRRGDSLVIASGAYAGTWIVERQWADLGGGVALFVRQAVRNQIAGAGVIGTGGAEG